MTAVLTKLTYNQKRGVRRAARRGARWLDETRPGWYWKVKLTQLDLTNGARCVLGQLAQSIVGAGNATYTDCIVEFADGCVIPSLKALSMTDSQAEKRGFMIPDALGSELEPGYSVRVNAEAWALLNDEWKQQIRERRKARRTGGDETHG